MKMNTTTHHIKANTYHFSATKHIYIYIYIYRNAKNSTLFKSWILKLCFFLMINFHALLFLFLTTKRSKLRKHNGDNLKR